MINFLKNQTVNFFSRYCCFPVLMLVIVNITSCAVNKPSGYFKNIKRDTVLTVISLPEEELKIKAGDLLFINLSSLNKAEDDIFNSKESAGYEVGKDGEIYIHRLGKLLVQGLTRKQLRAKLEEEFKPYLRDPVATVNFANHHVTILGEIGKPQIIPMPGENLSIIDALAQSGNVTQTAELSSILVIRDSSTNKKIVKHINLEDHTVFNSAYFYLQPNDVVVLNPNESMIQQEQKRLKYQQFSSIILQAVTIGLVIYQTFFRN